MHERTPDSTDEHEYHHDHNEHNHVYNDHEHDEHHEHQEHGHEKGKAQRRLAKWRGRKTWGGESQARPASAKQESLSVMRGSPRA